MKKMIQVMSLVLIGISIATGNAHARSLHSETFTKKAELLTWKFAEGSDLSKKNILGGTVKINQVRKKISIVFDLANNCPANAHCFAFIPNYTVELPLISITKDSCGVITYVAERNTIPVDGDHQKLVVKDSSTLTCRVFYPDLTSIEYSVKYYDRLRGKPVNQVSNLTADELF